VRDLLRLLSVIVVDMLLNRVTLSEKVHNFALVCSLLDAICVDILLLVHDVLALSVKDLLTTVQCILELAPLILSLAQLPFGLVYNVLLQPDRVKLRIELTAVGIKCIRTRPIVSENLRLVERLILSTLLL